MHIAAASDRQSEKGIALVITLIMLSVTLVMAVAFLALSQRERKSVSTATDTTTARLAADSALAAAQSQIMANLLNTNTAQTLNNGLYNFDLLVSTNYINTNGFNPVVTAVNPTNVSYQYANGSPISGADFVENVANLQYLPRVPVFIVTNTQTGSNDFRYYLDLNRNGQFEDSGYIPDREFNNVGVLITNGFITAAGDPQWIGVLARPDITHSPNNPFVSRYAFFAAPIGNSLDLNAIHNQSVTKSVNSSPPANVPDGYFRNQGVGSWEINLAAFLADLNTNQWGQDIGVTANYYRYNEPTNFNNNTGVAFDDARALLSWRYNYNYNSLALVSALFDNNYNMLINRPFDIFPLGALMTNSIAYSYANDSNNRWAGSDNANQFFDLTSEIFDSTKSSPNFVNHLQAAANGISTYDRYTFSRMLDQLGTDSDPDDGKMNLNYSNTVVIYNEFGVATNISVMLGAETNLIPWRPADFFTAAANRLLLSYTADWFANNPSNYLQTYYGINDYNYTNISANIINSPTGFGLTNFGLVFPSGNTRFLNQTNQAPIFGVTNIPVYINGQFVYSPAVNRLLQLALNMYDASTTNFYPSVFRPLFEHDGLGNVFIVGYTNVANSAGVPNTVNDGNDNQLSLPWDIADASNLGIANQPILTNGVGINVYGVPWIIGAKKGFPNFNKLGMQNILQVTRKLQVKRSTIPTVLNSTAFTTNQLLAFSVSNSITAECWNSYNTNYPHPVQIVAHDVLSMRITNSVGAPDTFFYNRQLNSGITVNPWPGYGGTTPALSFTNPFSSLSLLMSNSIFYFGTTPPGVSGFQSISLGYGWESNKFDFPFPQFGLLTTNRFQLFMLDNAAAGNYHVIDYVHFAGPQPTLDITAVTESNNPTTLGYGVNMWSQSLDTHGLPYGVKSQINASLSPISANGGTQYWSDTAITEAQIDGFASFMGLAWPYPLVDQQNPNVISILQSYATNYVGQAPYTPTVTISQYSSWQANDPLVHNLSSDLNFFGTETVSQTPTGVQVLYTANGNGLHYPRYDVVNDRYQPWGKAAVATYQSSAYNFANPYNLDYKDPLVWASDNWDFPTNVYPAVGWLGRVHRGSPWQTVYLKATNVLHDIPPGYNVATGTNTWVAWTGDVNNFDAANSTPVQDRALFDLFTARLNDNAARGTLSVNQTHLAAWSAIFSGMVTLTNTMLLPGFTLSVNFPIPATSYSWNIIQPAGINGLNSLLGNLVTNINNTRTNFINTDGVKGSFEHIGDILSTAALTQKSPYLNLSNTNLLRYSISDEVYEWLPQQMMGLLRASSTPRYVIYCYGQALRPAANGLVTSAGSNFGLITNYQVVAESAVRAIVSVQSKVNMTVNGPVTNYTSKVESYNVLPPN